MAVNWNWWTGIEQTKQQSELGRGFGTNVSTQPFQLLGKDTKIARKRLIPKIRKFGFKATAKWLFFDFISAITFGAIKQRPIQEDSANQT